MSSSEQYSSGGLRVRVTFASKRNSLRREGQKYCRHPIDSVAQWQRLFKALCEYCSDCIQRRFYKSLNSAVKSRASLIHLNN